jgi:hypothetical protein
MTDNNSMPINSTPSVEIPQGNDTQTPAKTGKKRARSMAPSAITKLAAKLYESFAKNLCEADVVKLVVNKSVADVGALISEFNGSENHGGKKKVRDPEKPKNPTNGFFRYQRDAKVKDGITAKYLGTADEIKSHKDFTAKTSLLWKSMGADEKMEWEGPYLIEKAEYDEKMKAYKLKQETNPFIPPASPLRAKVESAPPGEEENKSEQGPVDSTTLKAIVAAVTDASAAPKAKRAKAAASKEAKEAKDPNAPKKPPAQKKPKVPKAEVVVGSSTTTELAEEVTKPKKATAAKKKKVGAE